MRARTGPALALLIAATTPTAAGDPLCTLSAERTETAIQAFAKMAPVFADLRCANCHGGVNPFAEGGGHAGGQITLDMAMRALAEDRSALVAAVRATTGDEPTSEQLADAEMALRTWFSVEPRLTDGQVIAQILGRGNLTGALAPVCGECHATVVAPWQLAHSRFAGRSSEELCAFFQRTMEPSGFLQHVTEDRLGFIPIGFAGTRALTPVGQGTLKAQTGRDYVPEPVRAQSFPAFVDTANRWVGALGRFHKPPECGCRPIAYVLAVELDFAFDKAMGNVTGTVTETQAFEAPIVFGEGGRFTAEAEVAATRRGEIRSPQGRCDINVRTVEHWTFTGRITGDPGTVQLSATVQNRDETGEVVCRVAGRTVRQPVTAKSETHGLDFGTGAIPAEDGAQVTFRPQHLGGWTRVTLGFRRVE